MCFMRECKSLQFVLIDLHLDSKRTGAVIWNWFWQWLGYINIRDTDWSLI